VTHGRAEIHQLLVANDLRPSRALGQNFVADANTTRRIARLAELAPGQRVVEIGAGLGALTLALADTGARVTAVEIDQHLLPVLRTEVEGRGVRVVQADALTLALYPYRFELEVRFALREATLSLAAFVRNKGEENMPASFGYHPAFRWPLPFGDSRSSHFIEFDRDEPAPIRLSQGPRTIRR